MNETNKKLQSITARIIKMSANWNGDIYITFEVAAGYDDGSAGTGLDVIVTFADQSVTAKTNDYGVALLEFKGRDSDMNAQKTREGSNKPMYTWSVLPKFLVRIKGYAYVVELSLPLKSISADQAYRW